MYSFRLDGFVSQAARPRIANETSNDTLGAAGTVLAGAVLTHTVAQNTEVRDQSQAAPTDSLTETDVASFTQTMDGSEVLGLERGRASKGDAGLERDADNFGASTGRGDNFH